MRRKLLLMTFLTLLFTAIGTSVLNAEGTNVAKVGNTEYATIDEAIANWANNTTLTLLADVTLSDVVTIKSTEHHILNLGTYTMTAASGKNAFVIQACGTGDAERNAITINADATNPGGIDAGSKCVVYYKYADGGISGNDRPIIKINGGVFTGSTSSWGTAGIYTIGEAARKCATLNISGGTFNCTIIGSGKSKLIVSGGMFNYSVSSQGDSTALRLISGGTFKTIGFMTADSNNTKFWIGTSMGNSNVGVHVDDNGYIVVGGPVVTEAGESFEASSANYSGASSYLQYSSAKDNDLYYTSVKEAFADNNKSTGSVTVYVEELDMTGISYKGTIVVPEGKDITITNAPTEITVIRDNGDGTFETISRSEDGTYTTIVPEEVATYDELVAALVNGGVIKLTADITATGAVDGTDANIDLNGKTLTLNVGDNNFYGDSKVKNGSIKITGCVANGDCIIGIGDYSNSATLTFDNVNVTGDGYSSAYAVLYVYNSSELNINGGSVVVSNDNASAGGVIKAHKAADGKINIVGTQEDPVELTFNNAKIGMLDGTVLMDYVDLDITGGANAINQSALTIKNSTLDITGADGRALTLSQGNVVVENSTLNFSNCSEGEIRFKKSLELTADNNSTINTCTTYADASAIDAKINGVDVDATEGSMAVVTVVNGTTTVKEAPKGNDFTGYTSADAIWGEVWGNATESFVIKVLDANGNVMGTTSLNNVDGIIDGDVTVTWSIYLDIPESNGSGYWTMEWTTAPKINNMPAKVELWVDGVKVSGGDVVLNAPDNLNKIYVAVTDEAGKIYSYHTSIADAITAINNTRSVTPNVIALLRDTNEEVTLPAGITLNLNGHTAPNVSLAPVASVNGTTYTDLQDAIVAAAPAGTVEILADVVVDEWIMFSETLNISSGQIITMNINGLTINGNNNAITIKSIESASNGNRLFYDATNLNIKDLTINYEEGVVGGIGLTSGTISNVTFNGGVGVLPGDGDITISGCTFNTSGSAIYNEKERDNLVVTGNTFNTAAGQYAIYLRGNTTFTDNTVITGKVNVVSGSPVVTGNNFGTERFKVYNAAEATISNNTINNLVFNDESVVYSTFTANTLSDDAQAVLDAASFMIKVSTKAELNAAIDAANDGDVIEMTADIDYGTDQLAIAKAITLDLGGKTLTTRNAWGGMSIKNNPTVKNGTIVHASNTAAIKVWNATAFEDLVIDVQGKGDANKTIGGIVLQSGSTTRVGSIKNVTIEGDALTNGIETYNCGDATDNVIGSMENVNIDAVGTAMLISAPCGTATYCTFDGGVNGIEIWIKGNYSASLGLVDCDVVGGVFAHDEFSSNPEIVNNGTLNLTADETTTGAGVDDVTLTLARAENVDGVLEDVMEQAKAKVNNTYYQTLQAAIDAAKDREEIDLLKNVELTSTLLLTKNNILDGNGFKLTPAEGFTYDGNNAVIVLAANMSGYDANRTYTVKNLTIEGFNTPSRIVRANFCNATIQNCLFDGNASASIITSAYAVLNVEDNIFTDNTATGYAVIDVGSDVSDGTNLVAKIIDNTFENNEAAIAGIFLASSADVTDNHFKNNTHTGDNANAAAILAGPYTGNTAYTVNINSNAFENAMSKDGTALPSVFAEDWSFLGSTTSFDLSLNYWDGEDPVANNAYTTSGDNPQVTVKSYYKTYEGGILGGLVEYPQGDKPIGYVSETTIWGETWSNASTSYVIKVKDAEGNVMGTSTLNPELYTFNGNAAPTWHISFDPSTDSDTYWIQEWTTVPSINNMPAKVALCVDGVEVNEGPVKFNSPDDTNKIYAATADAEGKLIRFYNSIETIVNNEENVNVVLVRDVTGSFETFHNVTLYSGVEGGASITNTYSADYTNFNKVIVKNGVTLNMNRVYSTTAESVNTIEGTMNVVGVYYHSSDAKTEIKNGGKVTTGGMTIVRYNNNPESGIYIYGDGDDTTIEFSCQGDAIGAYSGTFYAEDAVVETKDLRLDYKKDNSEESDVYAQINAKFVDTKLDVSSELRLYKDAALTLNGATVTAGKVQIRQNATPTININNSTIKANSVENLSGATWNAVMDENGYVTFVRTGLAGEGTEANPYLINNLEDLVFFRDQVNTYTSDKSNQFKGKFVKLTNDIDLQGINWTPIGTNSIGDHAAFLGTFYGEKADGTIPTISNLYINANGDHLGFFARVGNYGDESCTPTIKNIKFNNVDVSSNTTTGHGGSYVAGVIANAGGNSVISNIEVTGDVYVVGYGYIGGIVGHGYPDIDNCHVIANEGSYIQSHYWCCGGIIGYAGEGGTPITNSSVSGVDIWASLGGAAAVAGVLQDGNRIENVSASNVNITSDSDYCMGYIAGNGEASTLTEISIENVTATAKGNPITVTDAVAQIGNSIYFNLQDALNAGGNVTVLRDIALAEGLTVAADKTVVLDLNGKTITGTPAEAKAFAVITNKGDLTITDGTETEGKIVCDHKLAGSTGYAVNTITNSGTLKIAAGTIQNTSTASNQIGYAIDNNSTTGNAILVIEGGEVTASGSDYYDGIRQFCNSETNENSVTIIDGEVSSLWLQNPSDGSGTQNTKDVKGSFAINGGTLNNLYLEPSAQFAGAITNGHVGNISRFQTAEGRDLEGFISGGTFSSDVSEFCAKGFVCNDNGDGTYGVVEKSAVAKIDDVEYKYIQDAIDAANATDVINVVSSTTENITIAENDNITLTFSEGVTLNGYFAPFRGNLTINGGTINNTNGEYSAIEINDGELNLNNVNVSSARHAVRIDGAVTATIDGGEYTLTATSGTRHAVNVSGGAEVTIKAGTFVGPKGTTMDSGSAVCVQAGAKVTIEGGDFSGGKNHTLSADGNLIVTGGTFDQDPSAYLAQGYITKYNETTSRYEVFKGVAKIEDEYFASIQDAIDAAQNNDKIVVLENIDLSTNQFVTLDNSFNTYFKVEGKTVTIDLNGKTISGEYAIASPWLVGVFSTENNGHLTLEDNVGTAKVDITGVNGEVYALIANYESGCSITINGGTYILDKVYYGDGSAPGALVWSSPSANDGEGIRVNGGNFHLGNVATGSNASPWIFNVNGNNYRHIKVFGGTYNYNVFNQYWIFEVQTTKEYAIKYDGDEAGTWTVVPAVAWVNNQKQSGGNWYTYELGYATLVEAFAAAEDCNKPDFAETVTLLQDITLENTITVNAGRDVILDLNEFTVSQKQEFTKSYSMITNNGKLTIEGNGRLELEDLSNGGGSTWGTYIIENHGELIVDDATLEHLGTAGDNFSTCIPIQNYQGKVTVNEGAYISSPEFRSLRDFTAGGEIIINGGEFNGQIWMQGLGNGSSSLTIKGGEFGPTANDGSSVFITNGTNVVNVSIEGGLFNTKIGATDPTKEGVAGCITGGVFTTAAKENTNENLLNENFAFAENANGTWTVKPAQEQSLGAGYNWYSSYLNINTDNLLEALGESGISVAGNDWIAAYYTSGWDYETHELDFSKMYMIETNQEHTLKLTGELLNASEIYIDIEQGWNWIGYPSNEKVEINTALENLQATEGDRIVGQSGFADYSPIYGGWVGSLKHLEPTKGYQYFANNDAVEFNYNIVPAQTRGNNETAVATHYSVDYTKYPFNMTMVAVVDGAMNDNYEVAALVNGEVRGSARPVYVEALDTYMLFLTISGDEVEEVSFKYYDITTEEEYELVNRIEYSNNAMVGSVNEPYVLSRGTTGIGEAAMSNINIYPNPTTTGTEINLQATCDTVEVFNALGVKVAEYQNVDTIDALETAGIYVIRITNNGNVQNCRLVVK